MAQFTYNSVDTSITKMLLFYANYIYKLEAYRESINKIEA